MYVLYNIFYCCYASFVQGHSSAKTIRVFLPMLPESERNFPMVVACQGTTRVADLLGLICWQYTSEGRKPELK